MRRIACMLWFFAAIASAQQPAAPTRADSARPESVLVPVLPPVPPTAPTPAPPPVASPAPALPAAPVPPLAPAPPPPPPMPTPAQLRFQQGVRTAGRGVAQLRVGL